MMHPTVQMTDLRVLMIVTALAVTAGFAQADDEITYYKDVKPILEMHCTICHNDDDVTDADTSGGLSLASPDAILKRSKKAIVVLGEPEQSTLLDRLTTKDAEERMPKDDDPLAGEKIAIIRRWIESGAKLGTATVPAGRRKRRKAVSFSDLTLDLNATPPKDFFGDASPAKLKLLTRMAPLAPVTAVAFSPDGNYLACGSFRRVVIWDLAHGTAATVLTDPAGMVHALEFTPDGTMLWLAGGESAVRGELKAYHVVDWKPAFEANDAGDVVYGMAISPDGKHLATVSFDRYLRIRETPSGKIKHSIKAHSDFAHCVAFSKDGKKLVTSGKDKTVKRWDVATGKQELSLSGHNDTVLGVLFSPDGKQIYSTGKEPEIRNWDAEKGGTPNRQRGHSGIVYEMAWDRGFTRFVTGGSDKTVRTWKPDGTADKTIRGASEVIYSVALSPDAKLAAAGGWDGYVRLWDVDSGRLQLTLFSAARNDDSAPDWFAVTPTGYYSASDTVKTRSRFLMANKEIPVDDVAAVLARPAEVAKAMGGAAPAAVAFSKPEAPSASEKPTADSNSTGQNK